MSYCRFTEADAYIFESINGYFECCLCSIAPDTIASTIVNTREELLFHVYEHRELGDYIPESVDFRLLREIKEGTSSLDMSDLSVLSGSDLEEIFSKLQSFYADISIIRKSVAQEIIRTLEASPYNGDEDSEFMRGYSTALADIEYFYTKGPEHS